MVAASVYIIINQVLSNTETTVFFLLKLSFFYFTVNDFNVSMRLLVIYIFIVNNLILSLVNKFLRYNRKWYYIWICTLWCQFSLLCVSFVFSVTLVIYDERTAMIYSVFHLDILFYL